MIISPRLPSPYTKVLPSFPPYFPSFPFIHALFRVFAIVSAPYFSPLLLMVVDRLLCLFFYSICYLFFCGYIYIYIYRNLFPLHFLSLSYLYMRYNFMLYTFPFRFLLFVPVLLILWSQIIVFKALFLYGWYWYIILKRKCLKRA